MHKELHLISFDIPYPPNYGGIVDVYFKLEALVNDGYKVHLHCFQYKTNEPSDRLEMLCESVHYYKRRSKLIDFLSIKPYIVASRKNKELLRNLQSNNLPIFMEGIHCCYYLTEPSLADRNIMVRMHNIEWAYYEALIPQEKNVWKKIYYRMESWKLKKFEKQLDKAKKMFTITESDQLYYKGQNIDSVYLPAFHPYLSAEYDAEKMKEVLFHGSLDVHENIQAALWIIDEVAPLLPDIKFRIMGKNPASIISEHIKPNSNVELSPNPSFDELQYFIKRSQINLVITFQSTGIKLKLLNSLFVGGHVIANSAALYGSGLDQCVHLANTPEEVKKSILKFIDKNFTEYDFQYRKENIEKHYSNTENIKLIEQFL